MALWSWWKLLILEQRLYYGMFGKYNRYRCWCLKRSAKTSEEKLLIAKEVLKGPGVNTMEAQYNELYLRRHEHQKQGVVPPPRVTSTTSAEAQPERKEQA